MAYERIEIKRIMIMKTFNILVALALLAAPAFADGHSASGDAAAGEEQFKRQCVSCHIVADADRNVLAGRAAKILAVLMCQKRFLRGNPSTFSVRTSCTLLFLSSRTIFRATLECARMSFCGN